MSVQQIARRGLTGVTSGQLITVEEMAEHTKPTGDLVLNNINIMRNAFEGTPITSVVYEAHDYLMGEYAFANCPNLAKAFVKDALTNNAGYIFVNDSALRSAVFHVHAQQVGGNTFNSCSALESVDIGPSSNYLGVGAFKFCSALKTLVFRKDNGLVSLGAASGTAACFYQSSIDTGGNGCTIYIPQTMYDRLGDGTSLDYKANAAWAIYDAYGTIAWKSIESTHTDPNALIDLTQYYADGTAISTT